MPQADLLSFQPTLLFLPVVFLGGYAFFVTRWVPRIVLTLKARAWLTRYGRGAVLAGVTSPEGWPELFLMGVQFVGLVWVVTRVALVTLDSSGLVPLGWTSPPPVTFAAVGAAPVENFFVLWGTHRETLFFAPAAGDLTRAVERTLGGFGFFAPGRVHPLLGVRLKRALAGASALSDRPDGFVRG